MMSISYYYLMAILSVGLTSCAQLLLKGGASSAFAGPLDPASLVKSVILTPMIWGGILAMGLSLVSWIAALSRLDVSKAYQFTSLGIILTILGGAWLYHEPMSIAKIIGSIVIVIGVVIVAQS